MVSFLSSGHPVPVVLPQRLASWALQCYYALGRQCQFIMSFLSHFLRSIHSPCMWASPSTLPWLLGRLTMPCQGVLLAMWVLRIVAFICLRDFTLAGPAPFPHLVTALPCALPIRLRCPPPIPPSLSSSPRIRLVSPPDFCSWSLSGR